MTAAPSGSTGRAPGGCTPWGTNAGADEIARILHAAKRVVVVTHAKPDGDAAGSVFALVRTLHAAGVAATAWFVGPAPAWLAEVAGDTAYQVFPPGGPVAARGQAGGDGWDEADAVAVLDTGSWSQLAELKDRVAARSDRAIVIDHHLNGDGDVAARRLISPKAAATAEALAPICGAILGCQTAQLPRGVAEALYLGVGTDTKWLRLSNVTPATLRLAASLIEAGVDHTRLYELIEQQDTAGRWRLLGRALTSLEVHADGRVAVMTLRLSDFAAAGADENDSGGFTDLVQAIRTVQVSAVLTESRQPPGAGPVTKVSLRSKPGPASVDVNAVASRLGGGGHARAAGARMACSLDEAKRRVIEALT